MSPTLRNQWFDILPKVYLRYFNTLYRYVKICFSFILWGFFYSPEMAESSSFDVEEGDIILLGTDGLFDNMNEDMILDCLSKMKVQKYNDILQFHAETCMYIIIRSPVKAVIDTVLKKCNDTILQHI